MLDSFSDSEKREIRSFARMKGSGHYRWTCPSCSLDRRNKKAQCLSVSVDAEKVVFMCHHCQRRGAVRLEEGEAKPRTFVKGAVKSLAAKPVTAAIEYLKERGIREQTIELFGITSGEAFFPDLQRITEAVAFPYIKQGKTVGHKLRSVEDKAHVCDKPLNIFFGRHLIDMGESKNIVIAEGEIDCLSLHEANVLNPLSVPNGGQSLGTGENGILWELKEEIDQATKVILAVDKDEVGDKLAEEMARRIGKHKCWRVMWPEDCKDANDTLVKHGRIKVKECIDKAEPFPVAGLYEAEKYFDEVDDIYYNGPAAKIETGLLAVDEIYSVAPGTLTVVTGLPNAGKSTFVNHLMIYLARKYGHKSLICSFENPPQIHIPVIAEMMLHKNYLDREDGQRMSREELRSTYPFINEHFKFMQQDDGAKATVDSILERITTAVFRWGIRNVVIDPYSYVERDKNDSETQFISDLLARVRLVAQTYGLHIWFVAHTTKIPVREDGSYRVPGGYDVSGSGEWFAKPDFGLTVHLEPKEPGLVKVACWKCRFTWYGKKGDALVRWLPDEQAYICDGTSELPPFVPEIKDEIPW